MSKRAETWLKRGMRKLIRLYIKLKPDHFFVSDTEKTAYFVVEWSDEAGHFSVVPRRKIATNPPFDHSWGHRCCQDSRISRTDD